MKLREIAVLAFAILAALPQAVAQSSTPSASASASDVAVPKGEPKPTPRADRDTATGADARLCLEFPTNREVIACAEKYRRHKRSA